MDSTPQERINEMIETVMAVAQGDYSVQAKVTDHNDELDSLAMGLNMMIEDIKNGIEREKEHAAAMAVAEKMEVYRLLIETTNTGYVVIDTNGCVIDANNEYVKQTGHHDISDLIGKPVSEWTAPYEAEKNMTAVKQCAEQGFIRNFEIDYLRKDGTVVPVEINATVVKNATGGFEILTLCRDISQRKEIRNKLLLSTESEKKKAAELEAANQQLKAKELTLLSKMSDLERFNKLTISRELEMIKLKKRINELLEALGKPKEFSVT